jgi:hypothetical protein
VSANIALKHFRHFEAKIPALYDIAAAEGHASTLRRELCRAAKLCRIA